MRRYYNNRRINTWGLIDFEYRLAVADWLVRCARNSDRSLTEAILCVNPCLACDGYCVEAVSNDGIF